MLPINSKYAAPKIFGWKTYDNNFKTWAAEVDVSGNDVKVSRFDKPIMDGIDSDALKIDYYSPKINGFSLAIR